MVVQIVNGGRRIEELGKDDVCKHVGSLLLYGVH